MHNAAFAALGLDWAYVASPTPPDRLQEAVRGLVALGFVGANVTTPHKLSITSYCDTDVPSVNTLVVRAGDRMDAAAHPRRAAPDGGRHPHFVGAGR